MMDREKAIEALNTYFDLLEAAEEANDPETAAANEGAAYLALSRLVTAIGAPVAHRVLERARLNAEPGKLPTKSEPKSVPDRLSADRLALARFLYDFGGLLPEGKAIAERAARDLLTMDTAEEPVLLRRAHRRPNRSAHPMSAALAQRRAVEAVYYLWGRDGTKREEAIYSFLRVPEPHRIPGNKYTKRFESWAGKLPKTERENFKAIGAKVRVGSPLSPEEAAVSERAEGTLKGSLRKLLHMAEGGDPIDNLTLT